MGFWIRGGLLVAPPPPCHAKGKGSPAGLRPYEGPWSSGAVWDPPSGTWRSPPPCRGGWPPAPPLHGMPRAAHLPPPGSGQSLRLCPSQGLGCPLPQANQRGVGVGGEGRAGKERGVLLNHPAQFLGGEGLLFPGRLPNPRVCGYCRAHPAPFPLQGRGQDRSEGRTVRFPPPNGALATTFWQGPQFRGSGGEVGTAPPLRPDPRHENPPETRWHGNVTPSPLPVPLAPSN